MGKRIERHLAERSVEQQMKAELEAQLSKANQPKYFKWLWKNKKKEIALTLVGLTGCIAVTPVLFNPDNDVAVLAIIGAMVAIYGFTIGMALQPYMIYRDLIKLNYWSPNSPYQK